MPKGTAQQLAQVQEIPAAAQELPVVPIEPSKPSVPIRAPTPAVPKASMPAAPALPVTTPEGKVPVEALAAAADAKRKRAQPTALMLMGIAAGCLVAGILITMLILHLIGTG